MNALNVSRSIHKTGKQEEREIDKNQGNKPKQSR
jgi:hypothetical protein